MNANINHSNDELENVASNVLRDIEDADDFKVIKKLIKRAARHYHEAMTLRDHRLAEQSDKDTTAILEAAKELGRVEVLDAAISSSLPAYPNGEVTWIDPVSIQLKRGSRSEFLDAHREVV